MGALAVLEVLDRDGHLHQSQAVHHWPLRVGRALDNDLALSDPHVAAHHVSIEPAEADASRLGLRVLDSVNGLAMGSRHWSTGQTVPATDDGHGIEFSLGRTRLRLRVAGAPLAAELALSSALGRGPRQGLMLATGVLVLAGLMLGTYLDAEPDTLGRALAGMAFASITAGLLWCGLWALLSKTFTRQGRFGWHVKVLLLASLAALVLDAVPKLLAFMFSWPALESYAFVVRFAVAAAAIYFHLLAVELARPVPLRWTLGAGWLVAVGLAMWFNVQRHDRPGEQLYLGHLFAPALRMARPLELDAFIETLQPLKATLDKKAKELPSGDGTGANDEE